MLVSEAIGRRADERAAFLAEACQGDERLKGQVEELVALRDEMASSFLEVPAMQRLGIDDGCRDALGSEQGFAAEQAIGRALGPYRIVKLLARGGTGLVYLARRADDEYQQQVAIKLLHPGFDSGELIRRFRAERQILARLDHPNIAGLLDGGTTESGQPYLVMELIEGLPIDVYCNRERLSLAGRLRLVECVCRAVAYAHRNFVVHRDLKPSNILVSEEGIPKLLDFGIAKLLDAASFPVTVAATGTGIHPMTLRYASPEQVSGGTITTASDVYSLGVLLYELLTGRLPCAVDGRPASELARAICEREPQAPSATVRQLEGLDRETVCQAGAASVGELSRRLQGDLDAIVLMALRKTPQDRYRSVDQFADDLARHLDGQPVVARQGNWRYLTKCFVRRHRVAVLVASLVVVLLTALTVTIAGASRRIARERDLAATERDTAQGTLRFLVETFGAADPSYSAEVVTTEQVLDRGADRVVQELDGQPLIQASLFDAIGKAYSGLWVLDRAIETLERALALRREHLGDDHIDVARSEASLAWALREQAEYPRAEVLFQHALTIHRDRLGHDHLDTARVLRDYGRLLDERGRFQPALQSYQAALAVFRRQLEPSDQEIITTLSLLAILYDHHSDFDEAERVHRDTLELQKRRYGDQHPEVAITLGNLGHLAHVDGRLEAAEPLIRESLQMLRAVFDDSHVLVLASLHNLAAVERRQGKLIQARQRYEEVLLIKERVSGPDHPSVAETLNNLGSVLTDQGRLALAEKNYRRALDIQRAKLGERHAKTARSLCRIGEVRRLQGDLGEAEELTQQCFDILLETLGEDTRATSRPLIILGRIAMDHRDYETAERFFREGLEMRLRTMPADHWRVAQAKSELGRSLAAQMLCDEAEALLLASFEAFEARFGAHDPRRIEASEALESFYRQCPTTA